MVGNKSEGLQQACISSSMDNEPGTSKEADKNLAADQLGDGWTKSLKNIPEFSYTKNKRNMWY